MSCTADIYDKVSGELERAGGVDCECIGGGRIRHDSAEKKIHVYGYSMVNKTPKHSPACFSNVQYLIL